MTEYIREIKFTVYIDTNKKTVEESFGSFEELKEWWENYNAD